MAALISTVMSTKDKVPFFVNRCEEMGIEVLPPDVNSSDHGFVVSGKTIRFGLDAVKNVGHAAVEAIIDARARAAGLHLDLGLLRARRRARGEQAGDRVPDQVRGARLDRRTPQGDARGSAGRRRRAARRRRRTRAAARARSSTSAAGGGAEAPPRRARGTAPDPRRGVRPARAAAAREGDPRHLPLAHPLAEVRDALRARVDCTLARSAEAGRRLGDGRRHRQRVQARPDASGAYVMFATLDDLEGQVELFVRDAANEAAERIELDRVVLVRGRVDHKGRGETSLVVAEAEPFEPGEDEVAAARAKAKARRPDRIVLRVDAAEFGPQLIEELKTLFETLPGRLRGAARDGDPRGHTAAPLRARLPRHPVGRPARRARPAARPRALAA